ncbi:unnamed protein product [Urochloa decumbens]|uniref:Uncharacterized protein n=1 Tax=Urochloa decumbens TaxID=240449 RepID=A0ABC9B470_9POAL
MEFATGALGSLLPKLAQLLGDEYNLQKGTKKNIEFLTTELESINAALCKVGNIPLEELDDQVRIWSRHVREVSYDMEDIIDTFLVRVQGSDAPSKRSAKRFIKKMMGAVTKATTRHRIGQDIKDIMEIIKVVAEERKRYKVDSVALSKSVVDPDPRITALYTKATDLVGINNAREELITRLTKNDGMPTQQQRIISIFGFGGLGKTTLAKAVYDKIKLQFDCTAFVSVSRNPDINKLLKNIFYELDKEKYGNIHSTMLEETQLIDHIKEFLLDKRYLIVVDDIWDMKPWEIIRCALGENNMKSRIITTTRIIDIAEQLGGCYKLKPLTHDSSEKLFYGRIFGSKGECPHRYSGVSEKILKKCGGVPLAIITTSSLLANNLGNIEVWNEWCDSIGSGLRSNHNLNNMRKILSFSYYDLPSHLKTCLLYLSIFPEDCLILRDRLIWRWIAEGFVQHGDGRQSLYDIGLRYFSELLNRSLIQPGSYIDEDVMMPMKCRVHDMVLDLICSLSGEEGFVTTVLGDCRKCTSSRECKVRRLSIHSTTPCPKMRTSKLRSLTIFDPASIKSMPPLSSYHSLRVLDLEGCNLNGHPSLEFVVILVHLRFLNLLNTRYSAEIPKDLGKLRCLQILDLFGTDVKYLPPTIVELRQLMCLGVGESTRLPNRLMNLTSLECLVAGNVDSAHTAEELGHLTNLRKLVVRLRKDNEGRWDESTSKAMVGSLRKLHRIQSLSISLAAQVRREDIQVLGLLPSLRFLKVNVTGMQVGEKFMISADAFPCLISCTFLGFPMVPSMFSPGAMPRLEHFKFHILPEDSCGGGESIVDDMALGHLPSLRTVWADLSRNVEVTKDLETKLIAKLKHEANVHSNQPCIYWRARFIE